MSTGLGLVRAELTLCRHIPRKTISGSAGTENYRAERDAGRAVSPAGAASSTLCLPAGVTAIVRLTAITEWPGSQTAPMAAETSSATSKMTDEHIVADLDTAAAASLGIADVVVHQGGSDLSAPPTRLARIFARHPGCAVAACPLGGRHLVGLRDGRSIVLALHAVACRDADMGDMSTTAMCASLVHAWVANGRSLDALGSVAVVTASGGRPGEGWVTYRVDRVRPAGVASRR